MYAGGAKLRLILQTGAALLGVRGLHNSNIASALIEEGVEIVSPLVTSGQWIAATVKFYACPVMPCVGETTWRDLLRLAGS